MTQECSKQDEPPFGSETVELHRTMSRTEATGLLDTESRAGAYLLGSGDRKQRTWRNRAHLRQSHCLKPRARLELKGSEKILLPVSA